MSIDANIAALLDETAVTIECCYEASPKRYTFVCNIPGVGVGDTVLVPSAGKRAPEFDPYREVVQPVAAKIARGEVPSPAELWGAIDAENPPADPLLWFQAVRVMVVHDTVTIEPGRAIRYKWVAAKVDTSGYVALMKRNAEIQTAVAEAYKTNMRRSFKTQVLGGLEGDAANKLIALLAPTKG